MASGNSPVGLRFARHTGDVDDTGLQDATGEDDGGRRPGAPLMDGGAPASPPPTVMIADRLARRREQTGRALKGHDFEVVGEAADAAGAVALSEHHRPAMVLLAVDLPGGSFRAAAEIAVALPETAIVFLAPTAVEADLFEALRVGARGYLLFDTDPDRLPIALRAVLAGEAALPRRLQVRLMDAFRFRDHPRRLTSFGFDHVSLTPREWDVLELLRHGLTTAEIAERLSVTKVTIRTHVAGVMRKLGVTSRNELLRAVGVGDTERSDEVADPSGR